MSDKSVERRPCELPWPLITSAYGATSTCRCSAGKAHCRRLLKNVPFGASSQLAFELGSSSPGKMAY